MSMKRLCLTQSMAEISELAQDYADRCKLLNVPPAEIAVVNNCCQIRSSMKRSLPDVAVVLDVYHFCEW